MLYRTDTCAALPAWQKILIFHSLMMVVVLTGRRVVCTEISFQLFSQHALLLAGADILTSGLEFVG
jgi:hypothetical protein